MTNDHSIALIFVAHNKQIVENIFRLYPYSYVLFVGFEEALYDPRCIIARNLEHNIESEQKLLTFTAWYAIIKNNLFDKYKYLCIFEYDVTIKGNIVEKTYTTTNSSNSSVIYYGKKLLDLFTLDIDVDLTKEFIDNKRINYNLHSHWYPTTNFCIRRDVLSDFVDWYYPDCLFIKEKHPQKFSWYHERLFSVYMRSKNITPQHVKGLKHLMKNSHATNINT